MANDHDVTAREIQFLRYLGILLRYPELGGSDDGCDVCVANHGQTRLVIDRDWLSHRFNEYLFC